MKWQCLFRLMIETENLYFFYEEKFNPDKIDQKFFSDFQGNFFWEKKKEIDN